MFLSDQSNATIYTIIHHSVRRKIVRVTAIDVLHLYPTTLEAVLKAQKFSCFAVHPSYKSYCIPIFVPSQDKTDKQRNSTSK